MTDRLYISITGLKLKRFWHAPIFWRHAVASMAQARTAPGCLSANARTIGGIHHTMSVWKTRKDMVAYLRSGAHSSAIDVFSSIATGKVYGFEAKEIPKWPEARELWEKNGRVV